MTAPPSPTLDCTASQLGASERLFRELADHTPALIWTSDENHDGVYFNRRWLEYTGRTLAQERGQGWLAGVHPDDLENCLKACDGSFARREPFSLEVRLRRHDGQYRWFLDSAVPRINDDGQFLGFVGSCLDIEDSKRAQQNHEKQLKALEYAETLRRRQQAALDAAQDGIAIVDADGQFVYINHAHAQLFGYSSREELAGKSWRELFEPKEGQRLIETARRLLRHHGQWHGTIKGRRRTGKRFDAEVSLTLLPDGGMVCVCRDVTARKQAEIAIQLANEQLERRVAERTAELMASEGRIRHMLDSLPEIVWVIDPDQQCSFLNRKWRDFTGRRLEEGLGTGWMCDVHPDDAEAVKEVIVAAFRQRTPFTLEYRLRRHDGQFRWRFDTGNPWYDTDGQFAGFIGSCIDVTDRRRTQEELEQRRGELAHASRLHMVGEMAAGLAHEINQPLYAIKNFADGCVRRSQDSSAIPAAVLLQATENIAKEAARASEIVNRMRQFMRKQSPQRNLVQVNELVNDVMGLLHPEARRANVTIELQLQQPLPEVEVDAIQIEQVLVNLIRNSLEAVQQVDDEPGQIVISAGRNGDDGVEIAVRDSGCGFIAEQQQHLFDQFYTTKEEGMGLGLAISKSIVESHGGTLRASLHPDGGAEFRFDLPSRRPDASRNKG